MKLLFGPFSILIFGILVETNVIAQHNNLSPRHEPKCDLNLKLLSHERRTSIAKNYNYITLFTDIDCQGDSITFNTSILSSTIAFTNTIIRETTVSFKPSYNNYYNSSVQKFRLEKRLPSYFSWKNYSHPGEVKVVRLNSGQCTNITLPRKRDGDSNEVIPWGGTILSFYDTDCEGEGNMFSSFTMSTYRLSDMVKSIRVLSNWEFRTPCRSPCPTFLYSGSVEYEFWDHLFSIYNETQRKIFKERVNGSTNGFISWDFLFPAENVSAPNSTLDTRSYLDAIRSTMHLFTFLCSRKIGELGFTRDSIIFLESQSLKIERERRSQFYDYHHNDYNGYLLKNFSSIWSRMKDKLEALNSTCWVKVLHGNKENRFVGRLNYPVTFHYAQRPRENLFLKNDECKTLPSEFQNRHVDKVSPNDDCFILYEQVNCGGPKHWAIELNNIDKRDRLEPILKNDKTIKSVRVCDLSFNYSCSSCPDKFLLKGSLEYQFWVFFFGINSSSSYQMKFEEQVERSSNSGYISWDFLNGSMINKSLGDQYRMAFDYLFHILRSVQIRGPQMIDGFHTQKVETLLSKATHVLSERTKQATKVDKEWSDSNIATMEQLISIWNSTRDILKMVSTIRRVDPVIEGICGLVHENTNPNRPHIDSEEKGRKMANYGDDPWHAAIYMKSEKERSGHKLICGATLISPSVLVSAAHCFYILQENKAINNTMDYTIVLAKFTSNYSEKDDSQETRKIKELIFSPKYCHPDCSENGGTDIILIILEKPVAFNSHIRPACVDWNNFCFESSTCYNRVKKGRLVGWGSSRDACSRYLMTTDLPYISFKDCKKTKFTTDKFCAGYKNGRGLGAERCDSGGGLMFKDNDRYYLRGIVSSKNAHLDHSVATFTDLVNYRYWIWEYV